MFLTEQDVKVLFMKLAQETYQLHKNDAKSVRMWMFNKTQIQCFTIKKLG
jgi:hypothetical protein